MSEQISALIDGELDEAQLSQHVDDMLAKKNVVNVARDYQMIGDAIRGELTSSDRLTQSIMNKIEQEPTVLSPNAITQSPVEAAPLETIPAKNTALPRAWSVAASVAAVMVVGAFVTNQDFAQPDTALTAVAHITPEAIQPQPQQPTITASSNANIPKQYLEAHRASAPSVGSHYIQTANFSE